MAGAVLKLDNMSCEENEDYPVERRVILLGLELESLQTLLYVPFSKSIFVGRSSATSIQLIGLPAVLTSPPVTSGCGAT